MKYSCYFIFGEKSINARADNFYSTIASTRGEVRNTGSENSKEFVQKIDPLFIQLTVLYD